MQHHVTVPTYDSSSSSSSCHRSVNPMGLLCSYDDPLRPPAIFSIDFVKNQMKNIWENKSLRCEVRGPEEFKQEGLKNAQCIKKICHQIGRPQVMTIHSVTIQN